MIETLLGFGGGDLLAVEDHQRVIKHCENIASLGFHGNRLDRTLQQRSLLVEDEIGPDVVEGVSAARRLAASPRPLTECEKYGALIS